MLFNSVEFVLLFLPACWAGFFLLARASCYAALAFLTFASLLFYSWWDPRYLPLLVGSILFNYLVGLLLGRRPSHLLLAGAISANLALLFYFKYAMFVSANLGAVTGLALGMDGIILPLGISFFTFTQIAFLVDAWRGEAKECDPVRYFLFASFFPHLIAGPILHHKEMMPQFARAATFRPSAGYVSQGLTLFATGLFKKVALADSFAPFATPIFASASAVPPSFFEAWGAALAYTFQIYFDFSGYTDMALGAALLFGIRMPLNFASPYRSASIIDFWRRWHMTLSRFLRDYLYIPLGGNRRGPARHYLNLAAVMLLGGLWHGAGWNFIVWGALHGSALLVNHAWRGAGGKLPLGFGWAGTFLVVVIGWVFFRAPDLASAFAMLKGMAGLSGIVLGANHQAYLGPLAETAGQLGVTFTGETRFSLWSLPWILAGLTWCLVLPNSQQVVLEGRMRLLWRPHPAWALACGAAAALTLASVGGPSEFLYFNF